MDHPAYPPSLSPEDEHTLLDLASDYALATGLVVRPFPSDPANPSSISSTSAIHAPYSLYPSPFPKHLFEHAKDLQPLYNRLYAHITANDHFLEDVVGGAVAKVDDFQRRLYDIWKQVKQEGIRQPLSLGLFRSDYLLHSPPSTPSSLSLKQVEFNTISSSFGVLSTKVTALHRYLSSQGAYTSSHPLLAGTGGEMPENGALKGLARGLAQAHEAYGRKDAIVLMVTQDNERNAFDQRPLEYELVEQHGIRLVRIPLSSLSTALSLAPSDSPSFPAHALLLMHSSSATPLEVSVVYYRTAYAPTDYTSPGAWATRLLIERSRAIKCPSVAMQLAGSKKVQQVLASPEVLSRFVPAAEERETVQGSFAALYPLDDSPRGREALRLAMDPVECQKFVLKPQREGGGNNVYRSDIPPFLSSLAAEDTARGLVEGDGQPRGREGYILMSLIEPPQGREQVLVKAGTEEGARAEVVSELGVYGVVLLHEGQGDGRPEVLVNETVGHLLRTKDVGSDEGGVAVGMSVIDSPLLV